MGGAFSVTAGESSGASGGSASVVGGSSSTSIGGGFSMKKDVDVKSITTHEDERRKNVMLLAKLTKRRRLLFLSHQVSNLLSHLVVRHL